MHVVTRFFDRYGSPSNVSAEYNDFASWFLKTFAVGILNSVLTVLAGYGAKADGSKKYVSPRVLQQCLNYVNTAVAHAVTWKVMKVRGVESYGRFMCRDEQLPGRRARLG